MYKSSPVRVKNLEKNTLQSNLPGVHMLLSTKLISSSDVYERNLVNASSSMFDDDFDHQNETNVKQLNQEVSIEEHNDSMNGDMAYVSELYPDLEKYQNFIENIQRVMNLPPSNISTINLPSNILAKIVDKKVWLITIEYNPFSF